MKAYFTASLSGKGQYKEHYITIVNTLKRLGYEVIADHILKTDPSEVIQQEVEDVMSFYKRMQQWVKSSNVIVAEVSNPSTSVGYEIALALEMEKPVIALYLEGREPTLLKGNVSEKFILISYAPEKIDIVLKESLEDAKDQVDVRFNFFVSPKIVRFLDWIAKKKKMPRAVYLRRLIEEDMKRHKEFSKE